MLLSAFFHARSKPSGERWVPEAATATRFLVVELFLALCYCANNQLTFYILQATNLNHLSCLPSTLSVATCRVMIVFALSLCRS